MANSPRFEIYPRKRGPVNLESGGEVVEELEPERLTGDYGWRFRDANGKITFIGGEGFTRKHDAKRAAKRAAADAARAMAFFGDHDEPVIYVDE